MRLDWDDLRLFLDVARLGGLSAARQVSGLSPATLGRRVTALERQIGQPLFVRAQTGYSLTAAGEELLAHAEEVEAAMLALNRWREGAAGERVVRISAGPWTSAFLAAHIGEIWRADDNLRVELIAANAKVDIGRRNADIGIRNQRPTEQWLAGRLTGRTAYALYSSRQVVNGNAAGLFVGVTAEAGSTQSSRWLDAHHGDRIAVRGNDARTVVDLVVAGAGLSVLPCFIGDSDARLIRVTPPIPELLAEQWIVTHQDERHAAPVRLVVERLVALMATHGALMAGERPG